MLGELARAFYKCQLVMVILNNLIRQDRTALLEYGRILMVVYSESPSDLFGVFLFHSKINDVMVSL